MATTQEVREAIAAQLLAAMPDMNVYCYVPEQVTTPALVVMSGPKTYDLTMARGVHSHEFVITAVAGRIDSQSSQDTLDAISDSDGDLSVSAAIAADMTLGGLIAPTARVASMSGYGPTTWAGVDYLKADFSLTAVWSIA